MGIISEFFNAVIVATVGLFSLEAINVQHSLRRHQANNVAEKPQQ